MVWDKTKTVIIFVVTLFTIGILFVAIYASPAQSTQISSILTKIYAESAQCIHVGMPSIGPGRIYTTKEPGITFFVPPKGFNPLTASNAELRKYHFPSRPADPKLLAEWEYVMKHAKHFIVPTFKVLTTQGTNHI